MTHPILVTGAAGRVGGVGGLVVEAICSGGGLPVRAMVPGDTRQATGCGCIDAIRHYGSIASSAAGRFKSCHRRLPPVRRARAADDVCMREQGSPGSAKTDTPQTSDGRRSKDSLGPRTDATTCTAVASAFCADGHQDVANGVGATASGGSHEARAAALGPRRRSCSRRVRVKRESVIMALRPSDCRRLDGSLWRPWALLGLQSLRVPPQDHIASGTDGGPGHARRAPRRSDSCRQGIRGVPRGRAQLRFASACRCSRRAARWPR